MLLDRLIALHILPDPLIRIGIRSLLKRKLEDEYGLSPEARACEFKDWLRRMDESPIAIDTGKANEQHYEVPSLFYETVLGPHLKYSSGYWPEGVSTLEAAEAAMLKLTAERAALEDGHKILELGCGWGSLTLWMAARFPGSKITAVSNSASQREFIEVQCAQRGLSNVKVVTADMNDFEPRGESFDRVVSVEMFEHMRNIRKLLGRIETWMKPRAKLFIHVFAHRELSYPYEEENPKDWIARYFFTGGMMPSADFFRHFENGLKVISRWDVNGLHYAKTCRAWLERMDKNRSRLSAVFESTYGKRQASLWRGYWRIFFMACEELFAYRSGKEWFVSHTLMEKKS